MEITRETDYAVRCVFYLTKKGLAVTMAEEIAQAMMIPKSFLSKILQKLVKARIVRSYRGVKGGFRLAHDPKEISLLTVIEAIQGPVYMNRCAIDDRFCPRSEHCTIHPIWSIIGSCVADRLREYTFEQLVAVDNCSKGGAKA
jgi:Rrf2 family protein